jgi:hypothetical protein
MSLIDNYVFKYYLDFTDDLEHPDGTIELTNTELTNNLNSIVFSFIDLQNKFDVYKEIIKKLNKTKIEIYNFMKNKGF